MSKKKAVKGKSRSSSAKLLRKGAAAKGVVRAREKKRQIKGLTLMASAEEPESERASLEKLLTLYRPVKRSVTMRLDADVIQWYRGEHRGYQTRINWTLRKAMVEAMKAAEKKSDGD